MISHELKDRTSKPSLNAAIFNRDYLSEFGKYLMQQFLIKWLDKAHIVMGHSGCFLHPITRFKSKVTDMTNRKYCEINSIPQFTSGSYRNLLKRGSPLWHHSLPSRVTDRKGSGFSGQL